MMGVTYENTIRSTIPIAHYNIISRVGYSPNPFERR